MDWKQFCCGCIVTPGPYDWYDTGFPTGSADHPNGYLGGDQADFLRHYLWRHASVLIDADLAALTAIKAPGYLQHASPDRPWLVPYTNDDFEPVLGAAVVEVSEAGGDVEVTCPAGCIEGIDALLAIAWGESATSGPDPSTGWTLCGTLTGDTGTEYAANVWIKQADADDADQMALPTYTFTFPGGDPGAVAMLRVENCHVGTGGSVGPIVYEESQCLDFDPSPAYWRAALVLGINVGHFIDADRVPTITKPDDSAWGSKELDEEIDLSTYRLFHVVTGSSEITGPEAIGTDTPFLVNVTSGVALTFRFDSTPTFVGHVVADANFLFPVAIVAGDLLTLVTFGPDTSGGTRAGWTLEASYSSGAPTNTVYVYRRTADASDAAGPTYAVTGGGAVMFAWRSAGFVSVAANQYNYDVDGVDLIAPDPGTLTAEGLTRVFIGGSQGEQPVVDPERTYDASTDGDGDFSDYDGYALAITKISVVNEVASVTGDPPVDPVLGPALISAGEINFGHTDVGLVLLHLVPRRYMGEWVAVERETVGSGVERVVGVRTAVIGYGQVADPALGVVYDSGDPSDASPDVTLSGVLADAVVFLSTGARGGQPDGEGIALWREQLTAPLAPITPPTKEGATGETGYQYPWWTIYRNDFEDDNDVRFGPSGTSFGGAATNTPFAIGSAIDAPQAVFARRGGQPSDGAGLTALACRIPRGHAPNACLSFVGSTLFVWHGAGYADITLKPVGADSLTQITDGSIGWEIGVATVAQMKTTAPVSFSPYAHRNEGHTDFDGTADAGNNFSTDVIQFWTLTEAWYDGLDWPALVTHFAPRTGQAFAILPPRPEVKESPYTDAIYFSAYQWAGSDIYPSDVKYAAENRTETLKFCYGDVVQRTPTDKWSSHGLHLTIPIAPNENYGYREGVDMPILAGPETAFLTIVYTQERLFIVNVETAVNATLPTNAPDLDYGTASAPVDHQTHDVNGYANMVLAAGDNVIDLPHLAGRIVWGDAHVSGEKAAIVVVSKIEVEISAIRKGDPTVFPPEYNAPTTSDPLEALTDVAVQWAKHDRSYIRLTGDATFPTSPADGFRFATATHIHWLRGLAAVFNSEDSRAPNNKFGFGEARWGEDDIDGAYVGTPDDPGFTDGYYDGSDLWVEEVESSSNFNHWRYHLRVGSTDVWWLDSAASGTIENPVDTCGSSDRFVYVSNFPALVPGVASESEPALEILGAATESDTIALGVIDYFWPRAMFVAVTISGAAPEDLTLTLTRPGGASIVLANMPPDLTTPYDNVRFFQRAEQTLAAADNATLVPRSEWKPLDSLDDWHGDAIAAGNWTLAVENHAGATATLEKWALVMPTTTEGFVASHQAHPDGAQYGPRYLFPAQDRRGLTEADEHDLYPNVALPDTDGVDTWDTIALSDRIQFCQEYRDWRRW